MGLWAAKMVAMVLLSLGFMASVAAEGWVPTFEPILGTRKGGTRIRVQSSATGSTYPWSLSNHFLQLGVNGATLAADHIGPISDSVVESQFTMPSASATQSVVDLSFSRSGDPYVDLGTFTFYDGDRLVPEAVSSFGEEMLLALNPGVFPESLNWEQIRPSCGFRDGTVGPAQFAVPQTSSNVTAEELFIQCDEGASSISLNDQEYFPISSGQKQARMAVELMPPTHYSPPLGSAYQENEEEIPRRRLSAGPVCTCTDTAMGLAITVTYLWPTDDLVNATVSNGVTYFGYGGPSSFLIRITITTPGQYTLTSMYPTCAA